MNDVTKILNAIDQGDPSATDQLLPLVYEELRKLAGAKMANERPGQTLDATALVHEAYVRLVDSEQTSQWANRRHFFAAAAEAMRRILINNAHRKNAVKHGGGRKREEMDEAVVAAPEVREDLVALDEALTKLAQNEPDVAELVKLRYFAGCTIKQAAELLDISPRTADSWWAYARTWLLTELKAEQK